MQNDLRYFEYPQKPPTKKLWAFKCFTALMLLNILAFPVLFLIISVPCFVLQNFCKTIARGGDLAQFFCPRVGVFQKNSPGVCPGVGQAWN